MGPLHTAWTIENTEQLSAAALLFDTMRNTNTINLNRMIDAQSCNKRGPTAIRKRSEWKTGKIQMNCKHRQTVEQQHLNYVSRKVLVFALFATRIFQFNNNRFS